MMTDQEYVSFLCALAEKHLRPLDENTRNKLHEDLDRLSKVAWEINEAKRRARRNRPLPPMLPSELTQSSPIEVARHYMEESGLLDALDDASSIVFSEFRRSVIPPEDYDFLLKAGYGKADIEVLMALAVERARVIGSTEKKPSMVLSDASEVLELTIARFPIAAAPADTAKKRKFLNGVGKLLSGAILGVGNVLLVTGTVMAPNPATAYLALGSAAAAVGALSAGAGDLRGE